MRKIASFLSRKFSTIENRVIPSSIPLGISKQKPMKRTIIRKNKKKKTATKDLIFNKVISYLLSDYYMYKPLVSPQPTFDYPPPKQILIPPGDVALPIKGRNKKLIEKVVDFLEADSYLYSPLITNVPVRSKNHAENITSGQPSSHGQSERVEAQGGKMQQGAREGSDYLSRKLRTRSAVRKTVAYRESTKHVAR